MSLNPRIGPLLLALVGCLDCGGRSSLDVPPVPPPEPECDAHEDCPGHADLCAPVRCVDPEQYRGKLPEIPPDTILPARVCLVVSERDCNDDNPCTNDVCVPETGLCSYGPSTLDLDGDGHRAPLPDAQFDSPDGCGDDCNDASAAAYPGALEVCDGVDNDCNGVVDDGAAFVAQSLPSRVSGPIAPAGPNGLAFDGTSYLALYTGSRNASFEMYQSRLLSDGSFGEPREAKFTFQNADSSGGAVLWVGDRYGVAWQDRRDGNYESYFTILRADGSKSIPDLRLSNAAGFSVNVAMAFDGREFVQVWQDDRTGTFAIMAQRISVDGALLGGNVVLSNPAGAAEESPRLARGVRSLGLTYLSNTGEGQRAYFQSFKPGSLDALSPVIQLSASGTREAVAPVIAQSGQNYVVAWYENAGPTKAIYATIIDEDGATVVPARAITAPGTARSRYPSLVPLGDRMLVVFADDRDRNQGYELYSVMVDDQLQAIGLERRLTTAAFDSVLPVTAFGNDGNLGILFRDDRQAGNHHVWFSQLACVAAAQPGANPP